MADLFDVIADPTRREILQALHRHGHDADGEVSVGKLVAELPLSQPTVSKHLKTLRDTGLVTVREQGQHRYYRLEAARLDEVAAWIDSLRPAVPVPDPEPDPDPEPAAEVAPDPVPQPPAVQPAAVQPPSTLPAGVRAAARRAGVLAADAVALLGIRR